MASPPILENGTSIDGKYVVEGLLGEGGMAQVFSARNAMLGHRVAIKVLRPAVAQTADAAARFLREARAAVSLGSEHVGKVFDVGKLPDGSPYLVMEHLVGESLSQMLQRGPLSIPDAVNILSQICDALVEAHAKGIVHRDIKPANIFIVQKPNGQRVAKVLDFGISKIENEHIVGVGTNLTSTGAAMGTPLFMSPEQMSDAATSGSASDVWALAVTLYLMVSGRYPFEAQSIFSLARKVADEVHVPLAEVLPGCPAGLERLITNCLQKAPAHRLSMSQFLAEIELLRNAAPSRVAIAPDEEATHVVGVPVPLPPVGWAPSAQSSSASNEVPNAPRVAGTPFSHGVASTPPANGERGMAPALTPAPPALGPAALSTVSGTSYSGANFIQPRSRTPEIVAAGVLFAVAVGAALFFTVGRGLVSKPEPSTAPSVVVGGDAPIAPPATTGPTAIVPSAPASALALATAKPSATSSAGPAGRRTGGQITRPEPTARGPHSAATAIPTAPATAKPTATGQTPLAPTP